jgi:hypothetical protein
MRWLHRHTAFGCERTSNAFSVFCGSGHQERTAAFDFASFGHVAGAFAHWTNAVARLFMHVFFFFAAL